VTEANSSSIYARHGRMGLAWLFIIMPQNHGPKQ